MELLPAAPVLPPLEAEEPPQLLSRPAAATERAAAPLPYNEDIEREDDEEHDEDEDDTASRRRMDEFDDEELDDGDIPEEDR